MTRTTVLKQDQLNLLVEIRLKSRPTDPLNSNRWNVFPWPEENLWPSSAGVTYLDNPSPPCDSLDVKYIQETHLTGLLDAPFWIGRALRAHQ